MAITINEAVCSIIKDENAFLFDEVHFNQGQNGPPVTYTPLELTGVVALQHDIGTVYAEVGLIGQAASSTVFGLVEHHFGFPVY